MGDSSDDEYCLTPRSKERLLAKIRASQKSRTPNKRLLQEKRESESAVGIEAEVHDAQCSVLTVFFVIFAC